MIRARWPERWVLAGLVAVVVVLTAVKVLEPDAEPVSALVLPVMVAGWRLSRRAVVVLGAVVAVALVVIVATSPFEGTVVSALVVMVTVVIAYRYAWLRERWGLTATQGVGILLDLRDRLRQQGELPDGPDGWTVGRVLRSADDDAMRGDFTLALREGPVLQVVLVDVSGHGARVAPQAGLLAGAFGGLLGAVPPDALLSSCNAYVCRQGWSHTYATAVHLTVDTDTGQAVVRSAGHPPAHLRRATGEWVPSTARGPVLGLRPDPQYVPDVLTLRPGDTVALLSDGLVDERGESPAVGLTDAVDDWAESLLPAVEDALLASVTPSASDDQALVLVRRDRAAAREGRRA
jgi:hypothetical protein